MSRRWIVEPDPPPERIDTLLARRFPDLSRSRAAALIEDGRVLLNGRVPRKSEVPVPGDVVELDVPPPEVSALHPEPIPIRIVHEDADIAVVDKPAGLVVHPAPGNRSGTLVNALLHHVQDLSGIGGVLRPGIVHRLDKETSGLLVVAKNDRAHRALSAALKRRQLRRVYRAAAWGHLDRDRVEVDAPLARSPKDRQRMAVVEGGRRAVTRFRVLERWRAADFLEAELETGRTHQIRVHLDHIGHPVVGDATYGGGGPRRISGPDSLWARELDRRVPRQFLHATELEFVHPGTGQPVRFTSPLPRELADAAEWARRTSRPAGRGGA